MKKRVKKTNPNTPLFELQEYGQNTLGLIFLIKNKQVIVKIKVKKYYKHWGVSYAELAKHVLSSNL